MMKIARGSCSSLQLQENVFGLVAGLMIIRMIGGSLPWLAMVG